MPWSPEWRNELDPRLDPYRNRMAALLRHHQTVGHVLFLTERWSIQLGGILWWRRWSADRELAQPLVTMGRGDIFDQPLDEPELTLELDAWARNEFPLVGELLELQWLTTEEAVVAAPAVFGMKATPTSDGKINWERDGAMAASRPASAQTRRRRTDSPRRAKP
jgi:hypothetical protein